MENEKVKLVIVAIIVLLAVYFVPWLDLFSFNFGIPPCIGRGCHRVGGGGGMEFGYVDCRGYPGYLEFGYFGLICFPDAETYCRYVYPFASKEKCLCESYKRVELSAYRRFCPKNNLCYGNSFEYEFGCSENMERTCRDIEREISDRWLDKYIKSDETERMDIFKRGYITRGGVISGEAIFVRDICGLLCNNCDSILCNKNYLCEYAKFNQTTDEND